MENQRQPTVQDLQIAIYEATNVINNVTKQLVSELIALNAIVNKLQEDAINLKKTPSEQN
jgi:hypothetical protein